MPFTPETNNLSTQSFKFKLSATPNVEYRVQNVTLPGISLGAINVPTPFVPLKKAGNLTYDEISLTFIAGETLKDYLEIVNWMFKLGNPNDLSHYDGTAYNGTIIMMDSSFKPLLEITMTDLFPTNISSITLDSTSEDVEYAQFTLSMTFSTLVIKPVD